MTCNKKIANRRGPPALIPERSVEKYLTRPTDSRNRVVSEIYAHTVVPHINAVDCTQW